MKTVKGHHGCLTIRKNIDVSTCVAVSHIVHSAGHKGVYFNLEYCCVKPKAESVSPLEPYLFTPAPVPLLVLSLSVYQTRSSLIPGLNPFFHSHFSGDLTMNGLWYAYLSIILSVPFHRMGSCSMALDFLA